MRALRHHPQTLKRMLNVACFLSNRDYACLLLTSFSFLFLLYTKFSCRSKATESSRAKPRRVHRPQMSHRQLKQVAITVAKLLNLFIVKSVYVYHMFFLHVFIFIKVWTYVAYIAVGYSLDLTVAIHT